MQKTLHLFLFMAILALISLNACKTTKNISEGKSEKESIDELFLQEFNKTKDLSTNTVPIEKLLLAKQRQEEFFRSNTDRAVPGVSWEERGPNNVAGRIRAVLIDKNDATNKKVWVGGVGGGLWFTNDITATVPVWNKVNDFFESIATTCITQNPSNSLEMYAGTGEGYNNGGAQKGLGIWKTSDGGNNWARLVSTTAFSYVQDLAFDKNGKLYAAVRNDNDATQTGLMRSPDGGTTWSQVLSSSNTAVTASARNGCDIEVSKNGDIYVAMGVLYDNGGIYLSPAGATAGDASTWLNITPNATGVISNPVASRIWQRIKLASAPSDNTVLYAVCQDPTTNFCASIQQFTRDASPAGGSWSVKTIPKIIDQQANPALRPVFTRDQCWYDLSVSGVDACRTTDNGANWNQISAWTIGANEQVAGFTTTANVHADHHNFVFLPGSSSTAILATDGGIYYSTNINTAVGKPAYVTKNTGLNITQYYAVAAHPTATNYFLTGSQDNGSQKFTVAGVNNTTTVSGGDGGFCFISPLNSNNQITSYTYNSYFVSTDGGATFPSIQKNNRGGFINPTDYDGNNLYGSDDAGNFFRWLSPQTNGADAPVPVAAFGGGKVTHVSISRLTANRVYFGLDNGKAVRVNSAQNSGTGVEIGTPRVGSVSCIAMSATNEDSILVSYSNYGGGKIFVTANGTTGTPATFTNITGNLPDMPVRWLLFDPRSSKMVIAATELGIWSCDDITAATPQWNPTNNGLANTRVDMLRYRSGDRTLVAATHGRGLFTTVIPANLNPEINFSKSTNAFPERSSLLNGCINYTDYDVFMNINGAPSADANVTLSVNAGATATEGVDFDYTTNGVFGAGGSKALVFSNGATDSKTFKVRVYDDAIVEGTESFTLSFTTTGGGSSVGTYAPTQIISILDNDEAVVAPTIHSNQQIGANTDATSTSGSPFRVQADALMDHYFLVSELTAAGLVAGSNITKITLNVSAKNSTTPYNNFNIRVGHTTSSPTTTSGFLANTDLVTCYSNAAYNTLAGDNIFAFSTPFVWNGTSNIVVRYCYNNVVDGTADEVQVKNNTFGDNSIGVVYNYANAVENLDGCSLPTNAFVNNVNRPVTKFEHFKPGTPIETALNEMRIENIVAAGGNYNFFSAGNKLLARLSSVSQNLGCATAKIEAAGNGFTPFFGGQRSNKILRITPTTNGSTASYTVTFYMTTAELNGVDPSSYRLFKSTAATIAAASGVNTVSVPTTVSVNAEWASFTGTFTGFSMFFIGSPAVVLPLNLVNFSGVRSNNINHLVWVTANELNTAKFIVEGSDDAINYTALGTVFAQGRGSANYSYDDNTQLDGKRYYRLKIVDNDGKITYSTIIWLSSNTIKGGITAYPNPAKDMLTLNINNVALLNTEAVLTDMKGAILQVIKLKQLQQQVNISNLSKGIYLMKCNDGSVVRLNKQ